MISSDTRLRRPTDVRYRLLDGEAVVLCQKRAEALGLNEVGGRFLDLCNGETPFADIVGRIAAEYGERRETVEEDLRSFAAELVELGVVETVA